MKTEKVQKIIQEELAAALKEAYGRYGGFGREGGFTSGRYTSEYPRGGEDEPDYPDYSRGGYESEENHTLRYGLDFPDAGPKPKGAHRLQSADFGDMGWRSWKEARAKIIGDEFANKAANLGAWKDTDEKWAEWYLENQEKYEQKDPSVDPGFKRWYGEWLAKIRKRKAKKGM